MIKLGVLGLGNISSKAYLPLYIQMNDEVEFHYFTRNQGKLDKYAKKYNLKHVYSNLEDFFNLDLDACMIHTPTSTHARFIDRALDQGWHVFVDKPISQNYDEVKNLIDKAFQKELILFTGFNRRYVPLNESLKKIEDKTMLIAQKNRELAKQNAEFAIFDMMIHMIDTSLFILEEDILFSKLKAFQDSEGNLNHALVYLKSKNTSSVTAINMNAGARTETVELMSENAYAYMENLSKITWNVDHKEFVEEFGDWTPTLQKRGFEPMIKDFLRKINNNDFRKQKHALESHYYCMKLVQSLSEND